MSNYNNHPEIKPTSNVKANKLIVFLHGVGSDGNDLISLVPLIQKTFPDYHFFSPHGHEPYDMASYGRQWFSLKDRTPHVIMNLVKSNAVTVQEIIKSKQKELDINNNNTVIIGFSQGTMMGLYLTLTQNDPYKAMIAFSGKLLPPENVLNTNTPICIVHGADDEILPASYSENMANYFKINNIKHDKIVIPNLMHSIDGKGIEFAVRFLQNI